MFHLDGFVLGGEELGLVGVALGLVVGLIFVVDGWSGDLSDKDFSKKFRIRSFLYALGGMVPPLLVDWKLIDKSANTDSIRLEIFRNYIAYFGSTVILVLILFTLLLFISKVFSRRPASETGAIAYILDYLHLGYGYCRKRDAEELLHGNAMKLRTQTEIYALSAAALTGIVISVDRLLLLPAGAERDRGAETGLTQSLQGIEAIIRQIFELDQTVIVNVNVMRAVPFAVNSANEEDLKAFEATDPTLYSHVLVPVGAVGDLANWQSVYLPVPRRIHAGRVLPGAPLAFLNQNLQKLDLRDLTFSPGLSQKVRAGVQSYFKDKKKGIRYLISLPVPSSDGTGCTSVVNIELPNIKSVHEDQDLLLFAIDQSSPYMMLIDRLLK